MIGEKAFYLTKDGFKKIKEEYDNLRKIRIVKIRDESPRFLHSDDANPEYLFFYEDMDFLQTRMADLDQILKKAVLIEPPPPDNKKFVGIGAKVFIEVEGQKDEFEITGSLEANPSLGKISNESPVGRALLGHKVGDEVVVSSPIKTIYKINKIKYNKA